MKALLFVVLLLAQSTEPAKRYVLVSEGEIKDSFKSRKVRFYFDRDSFKRDGDIISATVKVGFPTGPGSTFERTNLAGLPVFSILFPVRFDCAKNKIYGDNARASVFDEQGNQILVKGKGKELLGQPSKDRAAHLLWEYVCERPSTKIEAGPPKLKPSPSKPL